MSSLAAYRVTVVEKIGDMLYSLLEENKIVRRDRGLKYRQGPKPSVGDARCLVCGHIWYNCRVSILKSCPKCHGLLRQCDPTELQLSGKRGPMYDD